MATVLYIRGRRFQPAALALTLAALAVAAIRLWHPDRDLLYAAVGALSVVVAVLFTLSWIAQRTVWMMWGLMGSTWLWVFVAGTGWTTSHSVGNVLISCAFIVLSAGSYWQERHDYAEGLDR